MGMQTCSVAEDKKLEERNKMEESVIEETQTVEAETTEVPQDLNETASETEMSEGTPSESESSPAEEEKGETRSQARIRELNRKAKEAEQRAEYWENLTKQAPNIPNIESEDGVFTADQVADIIVAKQDARKIEENRGKAQLALQQDIQDSIQSYPELEQDDDLAQIVYGYAVQKKISLKSAADQVISRMKQQEKKAAKVAEQKTVASQSMRAGVSSPQGGSVSNGQLPPPDVSNMSDSEKAANWDKILASYIK